MKPMVILFTMDGCPHCDNMKNLLETEGIEFIGRDINEYEDDYDAFVEATSNEYVPAFLVIEESNGIYVSTTYCPEDDFNELNEGIELIKKHII
jgi:glutaredoxin